MAKLLLKQFNLGDKIDLLIARALLPQPEILIMDEPSTGLDVLAKEYMLSVVRELAANTGITMLYVTHYAEEIQPLFQHTMLLKKGRVYAKGVTEELFQDERLSGFLEYPVHCTREGGGYQIQANVTSNICQLLHGQEV